MFRLVPSPRLPAVSQHLEVLPHRLVLLVSEIVPSPLASGTGDVIPPLRTSIIVAGGGRDNRRLEYDITPV